MILPLFFLFAAAPEQDLENSIRKLIDVLTTVQTQAADPVSTEQALYGGAIPGMLRRLDPHSVFFDPQQFEQLKQMERAESKGFGSIVSVLPGRVIVLQALPGTPSAKSGLSPGDEILAVNNVRLASLSFEQLVEFLGESRQHQAALTVRRPGNARLMTFTLNPELVDTPSIDRTFFLRPGIGYIRVASFDPQTGKLLKQAIDKLDAPNLKGLVLDLRNNPGGVVDAALQSASLFLQPGQKILSIKGRHVKGEDIDVPKGAAPYSFPIAILVNEKTASAAEIVTGALQDHDRAVVIGVPSYGKGLVQTVMPLSNNTGLALTTAFYYTPSGRSIQKPLQTGQLEFARSPTQYKTDEGRTVIGGGGIQPDFIVQPEGLTQLRSVLEASGILTAFATDYLQSHKVDAGFHVTATLLDDFQVYASERNIQPPLSEWISDRDWIQNRLEQEILNQSLGVAKGDEVEARRDPAIRSALEKIAPWSVPLPSLALLDILGELPYPSPKMNRKPAELLQGTLDLLVLKAISLGRLHGYGILLRIGQISGGALSIEQGALYPALYRLERQGLLSTEWGLSENNRKAKYYVLTSRGRQQLKDEEQSWNRLVQAIGTALKTRPSEV